MPDYNNGKIYKLWSPKGDGIYIGSTVNSLARRKANHKSGYINKTSHCNSKILFEKYNDVRIELIEEFPCENKMELNKKEGYYIRTLDCVNRCVAGRTPKEYKKEWFEDNKERIIEQKKEWHEKNKEHIKEYREKNREKIKEYQKEYDKQYNEKNKEKIKEKKKQYYENNKDEINKRRREQRAKKKNLVSVQSPVLSPEHSVE
jgi:hypothetical protein